MDRRSLLALLAGAGAIAGVARAATTRAPVQPPPPLKVMPDAWPRAERLDLWPQGAPGVNDFKAVATPADFPPVFLHNTRSPTLHVFRPDRPNGTAVLAAPGGGYEFVSIANEGVDLAARLNPLGYTVFVLNYRLPAEGWRDRADVPLQDAQRATRLIKSRARDFRVDPEKIVTIGFSAGGHVTASLATTAKAAYEPVDAWDQADPHPAAVALIYPVITMTLPYTHAGSRRFLLGDSPSEALVDLRSAERHVDAQTPPLFLVHACDDPAVPVENSLMMFEAARRAKIPVEAHFPQEGGHAFGVGAPGTPASQWPTLLDLWLSRLLGNPASAGTDLHPN